MDDPVHLCLNTENLFWETTWKKVKKKFAKAENPEITHSEEESASSNNQRSDSFLSQACYSNLAEEDSFLSDVSDSASNHSGILHQRVHVDYKSVSRSKRNSSFVICDTDAFEEPYSCRSSKSHHCSAQNSPSSTPVPLRCKPACEIQITDKDRTVDIYIDVEQRQMMSDRYYQKPCTGDYYFRAENGMVCTLDCAPRVVRTAPPSPSYRKDNVRSYSSRGNKATHHHVFNQELDGDDLQPLSPRRCPRKIIQTLADVLPRKVKLQDYDSEITNTIEDTLDLHYSFNPNSPLQNHSLLCQKLLPAYGIANVHCREEAPFLLRETCFLEDDLFSSKHDSSLCFEKNEEKIDEELLKKLEEIEDRITLMDPEIEKLQNGSLCMSELEQMLREIIEDRINLKMELSCQLRSRIAERSSMKEVLKQEKIDLRTRITRLEKKKNELLSYMENELDRRSCHWLLKIEMLQAKVHRLRARMREVAEQNVSLQGEVSSLNGREMEARSRMMDSELQVSSLMTRLGEARNENEELHQMLSELQQHCDGAKADWDYIRRKYKEKEKENKELRSIVVRMQRMCNEQEKTVSGLRQGICNEILKHSSESDDLITTLQNEQVRLTGLEQKLRREIESCRFEMESLRHENIHLLERLLGAGSRCEISFIRLDQELHAWVDCLKKQCLTLLDDNSELCANLLEFVKGEQYEHGEKATDMFGGYSVVEYNMKFQSLRKAIENLRRSLQIISMTLDEKTTIGSSDHQPHTGSGLSRQLKSEPPLDEMEYELKAETLLNRILREKLCHRELELEQWQAELATSVRGNEILKSEIQRLQDDLSYHKHKTNQMELQMLKKDDELIQLQCDLQEWTSELTTARGVLPKISKERDRLWKEVKQLKEINMLLECEVKSLTRKIEALDEEILIKEGQISILKDNLYDKLSLE